MNYYNDNDPSSCAWLRELIKAKLIPEGFVDERSINEIQPSDLASYDQCHFFAGIGGWAYALQLAECLLTEQIWTGSCPCQPFSCAGKRKGEKDERHLWPEFARLIRECKPSVIYGEQVASKDGRVWLSGVRSDLEAMGYAVGASDLCAAGVGAPHIRQRLFWVADSNSIRYESLQRESVSRVNSDGENSRAFTGPECRESNSRMANNNNKRSQRKRADNDKKGREGQNIQPIGLCGGAWSNFAWIFGIDGKARRIESGTFPLAYGIPNRVVKIKGLGNAIVPQVAAEFVKAHREITGRDLL